MKTILSLCLLLVPVGLAAQEGSVTYDHTVVYEFAKPDAEPTKGDSAQASPNGKAGGEGTHSRPAARAGGADFWMPEGMPTNSFASVVLRFNASESVMAQAEEEEQEAEEEFVGGSDGHAHTEDFATRIIMSSPVRSAQETLLGAYSNNDGTLVEEFEFMGRMFRIRGIRPVYEWRLVAEQSEFMGYAVQKAETDYDGKTIEAWFAPQVPVSAGPGQFGGLPGLILVLSVNRGEELYSATSIDLGELETAIGPPEDGDEISREDYEQIVEEKLEELRTSRGGHRVHRIS
ncbi:MAG: GLPGLI family protein [Longimicrobiales bacterium]|jgi:GLPGLI family protein